MSNVEIEPSVFFAATAALRLSGESSASVPDAPDVAHGGASEALARLTWLVRAVPEWLVAQSPT